MIDRALYLGMVGGKQAMTNMHITANNLANVNTVGHRAEIPIFSLQEVQGDGYKTRYLNITSETKADFTPGSMMNTDRNLDISIKGDGWFTVQTLDGREAYTRNGNFTLSPEGFLKTPSGHYVMGQRGLITIPPAKQISIGEDGTISVQTMGQSERDLTVIDKIKLVNPTKNEIMRGEDGLFYSQSGEGFGMDPNVRIQTGFLETSNVNAVQELVNMIDYSRQFELQIKMMQNCDENAQKATKILEIN